MHRHTCRADSGLAEVKRKRQQTRQLILLTTKNWNDLDADMELSSHVRVMITICAKKKGVSQEALAHACDRERTYIGGVERGERGLRTSRRMVQIFLPIKQSSLLCDTQELCYLICISFRRYDHGRIPNRWFINRVT
jgi:hypothetical protein